MLISIGMHNLILILPYIIFFNWQLLWFDGILLMTEINYRDMGLILFPKALLLLKLENKWMNLKIK